MAEAEAKEEPTSVAATFKDHAGLASIMPDLLRLRARPLRHDLLAADAGEGDRCATFHIGDQRDPVRVLPIVADLCGRSAGHFREAPPGISAGAGPVRCAGLRGHRLGGRRTLAIASLAMLATPA
ncbi:MAG: hypothetical protein U1E17_16530 [Geminicoccaceae bacterium]